MAPAQLQVAVIGGGLAGLTHALYLNKYGINCAVYEARSQDFVSGGNIALSPNALRALDHIGIYEKLRTRGFAFDEVVFLNGSGVQLAKVYNGGYKVYNFPALRVQRTILRGELLKELARQGIPVYYDRKCKGIREETDQGAIVEFEDGKTVTAEYVVGADGIHSRIRAFVRPDAQPVFQDLAGISGTFNLSDLPDVDRNLHFPNMLFGAKGSFAIMPATPDGNGVSYFATFELEERSREEWAEMDKDKQLMSKMIKERFPIDSSWPEIVRALCDRAPPETLTFWPFYQLPAGDSWSSPLKRIILIGDAAHAMPPTGGQGGASSMEDAETLGYMFAHIYAADFDKSLAGEVVQAWENHRIPRVKDIMEFTSQNGNLRKTSRSALHQWLKELAIWSYLKWTGPKMASEWMYAYNGESVRAAFANIGRPERKPGLVVSEK